MASAATVSVAQRTDESSKHSAVVNLSGEPAGYTISLKMITNTLIIIIDIRVPSSPNNVMYPIFLKKFFFFNVYPAPNIIGGSTK